MDGPIRVLMITSGWPTPGKPQTTHFIKRQAEYLRAAGVDVDVFRFRGLGRLGNYARGWLTVRRKLATGRYDLVHAQWGQSALLALPKRLPLVITFRGCDLHGIVDAQCRPTLAGRLLTFISRQVARRADTAIVVSEHMTRLMKAKCPVHVIPSGLDLDLFRPIPRDEARRSLGLPADKRLVLFVGDPTSSRKRYGLAREAVAHLARTLPAELVVAWGAPHAHIPLYMSACDALLFTSMQEGSPNVVKEALACNLPVVSVPVGDVAERLRGIEGCALCPDERPEALADALGRVLRRGERCAGREAIRQLDENATTEQVISIYRSLLSRPASWRGDETRTLSSIVPGRAARATEASVAP